VNAGVVVRRSGAEEEEHVVAGGEVAEGSAGRE